MRQSKIYMTASSPDRVTDKGFGSNEQIVTTVMVGASKTNSKELATVCIGCYEQEDGTRQFGMSINGQRVALVEYNPKDKTFNEPKYAQITKNPY